MRGTFENIEREAEERAKTAAALDNWTPPAAHNGNKPQDAPKDDAHPEQGSNESDADQSEDAGASSEGKNKSQATILVELAGRSASLFHDNDGNGYARLKVGEHYENWSINSRGFKDWLAHSFYREEGRAPNVSALNDALATIGGQARFDGPESEVATRIASYGGAIYIDLCDEEWRSVEIDAYGWRIVNDPPVRFVRSRGMAPLPQPQQGDPDLIWHFVNVSETDRPLVRGWLDAAMRPYGPYPILVLQGEQGTGKSTQAKVLRSMIDPSMVPVRAEPKAERDLMIAGNNGWVISLDNLSGLSNWMSDALCRIATGGGFATRELYSDSDEVLINIQRPIILNGIDDIATRQDLIDRAVIVNLDPIPDSERVEESRFWTDFHKAQPQLLGACFDRISRAIREIDHVKLDQLPRMAGFARWAYAAGGGDEFMAIYDENRKDAIANGLEGSPVAQAIRRLVEDKGEFSDNATVLLAELERYADESHVRLKSWPKSAKSLANQMRRLATALRAIGIEATSRRDGRDRKRTWNIQKVEKKASAQSAQSACQQNQGVNADELRTNRGRTADDADESRTKRTHCGRTDKEYSPHVNPCFVNIIPDGADDADDADANLPDLYDGTREVIR